MHRCPQRRMLLNVRLMLRKRTADDELVKMSCRCNNTESQWTQSLSRTTHYTFNTNTPHQPRTYRLHGDQKRKMSRYRINYWSTWPLGGVSVYRASKRPATRICCSVFVFAWVFFGIFWSVQSAVVLHAVDVMNIVQIVIIIIYFFVM